MQQVNVTWYPGVLLDDNEQEIIESCYRYCEKNKTQTALALGIAIRTLDYKLALYKQAREGKMSLQQVKNMKKQRKNKNAPTYIPELDD